MLLLIVLYNNNQIQEKKSNQKCQIFITLALIPFMGATSLRGTSLLQSATVTRFNVSTMMAIGYLC